MAENFAALSLHSLSGTKPEPKHCRDGGYTFRYPDFLDFREIIDRDRFEIRFHHLKAFTKGMRVVWTFEESREGVLVQIAHDLQFRVSFLAPIADKIIGDFFIHHIANKTLRCMKAYVEAQAKPVTA